MSNWEAILAKNYNGGGIMSTESYDVNNLNLRQRTQSQRA